MLLFQLETLYGLPVTDVERVCRERYGRDYARLRMVILDPDVVQIRKDVRMSFQDRLGSIGGTLGLFTGVSLISIVEVVFWIYKARRRRGFLMPRMNSVPFAGNHATNVQRLP